MNKNEKNKQCVHRVDGIARAFILEYASRYHEYPAPYFFCNQNTPYLCLRAERIAKHCLLVMDMVGINTTVFNAMVTFLLSIGMGRQLVRARGQWTPEGCMD